MAQGMLTNYFAGKKRTDPFQPSKRRKVLRSNAKEEPKLTVAVLPDLKSIDAADIFLKQNSATLTPESSQSKLTLKTVEPVSKPKNKAGTRANAATTSKRSTRARASKQKSVSHGPMDKALARAANKKSQKNAEPGKKDSEEPSSSAGSEDSEVTSASDDHDAVLSRSLPGTPTKRSQKNSEAPIRRKRCKPVLSEETTAAEDNEEVAKESKQEPSNRQKRSANRANKSKPSVKKSLDKTFQKYEKTEQSSETVPVKKEANEDANQASNCKRTVQSKDNPINTEQARTKPKSKTTIEKLAEQSPSTAGSGPEDGNKSASNPLGNRIRATLKNQKSPVKLETPVSTSSTSKGKLTPAMVKDRLSKSGKLAELQSRLAKIKECADQAKKESKVETKAKPVAKETVKSKASTSSVPAYQKYHSLASPAPPSLTLPFKYKTLEQMFNSVDTVVSLLHNRKETCTFPKLKNAVQEMCRKTFELRNVGQIKTVYPTSFFLSQQKQTIKQRAQNKSEGGYELIVQPNLDSDGMSSAGQDSSEVGSQAMQGATSSLMKKFTPSMMIARRTIFHNGLIDIVKQHHKTFLSKLDRPLTVPDEKITRWHPKFPLDTIPEVEPSALPEPPAVKTYCNAKDVLEKARDMMTPRVVKALETVAKNSDMLKSAKAKSSSSATLSKLAPQKSKDQDASSKGQSSGLGGINQSLLERIRAKEAQKQVKAMMRDPEEEKKIQRLERLPELCRILRVFFLAEKKSALIYEVIVKKLGESSKSTLTTAEVEKHLDLMIEILPEWLVVHNIRKEKYIKMNKKQDINDVISKVNKIYKETK
ncbi:uncharacterized protein [Amphiura filiformis]|uniref:uncharacterized protein n=1 Tax=Amphiura filiformis TaxID=82378 RepID=UPI003B21859B